MKADLVLDARASRVRVHTFAEGLFARLAHDLEITCGSLEGTASRDAKTATIEAPLSALEVAGVLKDGRLDEHALSASDRRDIASKMLREVFHADASARLKVEATIEGVKLFLPNGRELAIATRVNVEELRATGSFDVSLSAIGSDVIKGPMNAFRVKDRVAVLFDVRFVAG
ncbi:MAG TPA: hypothetical protein VIF62_33515 [Labilithrix sp.]|jgi:hypothetical protein